MEAKDTVMSDEKMVEAIKQDGGEFTRKKDWWHTYALTAYYNVVAKAQAEISFKAGVEEGWQQAEAHYQIDKG